MSFSYRHEQHQTHRVGFYFLWTTLRARNVLKAEHRNQCRRIIESFCKDNEYEIVELKVNDNSVQLCVQVWPDIAAESIVRQCKRKVSGAFRKKGILKNYPSIFTRSYFVDVDEPSESEIDRFIAKQRR